MSILRSRLLIFYFTSIVLFLFTPMNLLAQSVFNPGGECIPYEKILACSPCYDNVANPPGYGDCTGALPIDQAPPHIVKQYNEIRKEVGEGVNVTVFQALADKTPLPSAIAENLSLYNIRSEEAFAYEDDFYHPDGQLYKNYWLHSGKYIDELLNYIDYLEKRLRRKRR